MLRFLTAGESHGKALVGIIEGLPSGLEITADYIHGELKRRKLGYGRGARQKIEDDAVEIISGVRLGSTLGSPIALMIANKDWSVWQDIMQAEPSLAAAGEPRRKVEVPRPGHADFIGGFKYAHEDMRNVLERSSARETAMRVAIASVARKFLQTLGIHVASRVVAIGSAHDESALSIPIAELNQKVDASPVRCTNPEVEAEMIREIESAKKNGDTMGGWFEIFAAGVPMGLGSYSQWDRRLEGDLAQALMSLNAIKGVEVGLGFAGGRLRGSQVHDEFLPGGAGKVTYAANRSGGIDGGMSSGQPIIVRASMKPLATLMKPLQSVNLKTGEVTKAHVERSDACAVPAAAVIGESLVVLVVAQAILEKFGGDSMGELLPRVDQWRKSEPRI